MIHRSENSDALRHAKIGDLNALAAIGKIGTRKCRENVAVRVAVRALSLRFSDRSRQCTLDSSLAPYCYISTFKHQLYIGDDVYCG
jgi:hypothetical protein